MLIAGIEFELCSDETFEDYREVIVTYDCGDQFGTLHLGGAVGSDLKVDEIHRIDNENVVLQNICDILDIWYKRLLND